MILNQDASKKKKKTMTDSFAGILLLHLLLNLFRSFQMFRIYRHLELPPLMSSKMYVETCWKAC